MRVPATAARTAWVRKEPRVIATWPNPSLMHGCGNARMEAGAPTGRVCQRVERSDRIDLRPSPQKPRTGNYAGGRFIGAPKRHYDCLGKRLAPARPALHASQAFAHAGWVTPTRATSQARGQHEPARSRPRQRSRTSRAETRGNTQSGQGRSTRPADRSGLPAGARPGRGSARSRARARRCSRSPRPTNRSVALRPGQGRTQPRTGVAMSIAKRHFRSGFPCAHRQPGCHAWRGFHHRHRGIFPHPGPAVPWTRECHRMQGASIRRDTRRPLPLAWDWPWPCR